MCFISSLGLNGIKVIVKSLGSGFHLPVPGLPRHDLVSCYGCFRLIVKSVFTFVVRFSSYVIV